ncbi:MAG: DUF4199 domain-containing protein [Bacteroidetes bacterium]|nr:DUF4199 domain-containing protein [Bacteroidota bacterium]
MEQSLKQYVIRHGLIVGFVQTILYYLIYFLDQASLVDWIVGMLFLLLIIAYPIVVSVRYRKANEGFLPFKDAFYMVFGITFIRSLVVLAFTLLLFFVIDTELGAHMKEMVLQKTSAMMEKFNTPQEAREDALRKIQEEDQFGLNKQLISMVWTTIMSVVFALLVALTIRKDKPIFDTIDENQVK